MESQKNPKNVINLYTEIWTSKPISKEFYNKMCIILPGIGLAIDSIYHTQYDNRLLHHEGLSKNIILHLAIKDRYKSAIFPGANLTEEEILESISYTAHVQQSLHDKIVLRNKRRV